MERGGEAVDDPLAWWDSLSDETVQFWESFWSVEPWGTQWERHAEQMSLMELLFAAQVNPNLEKEKHFKPSPPVAFMPPDYYQEKQPVKKLTNDEMAAKLDNFVRATTR